MKINFDVAWSSTTLADGFGVIVRNANRITIKGLARSFTVGSALKVGVGSVSFSLVFCQNQNRTKTSVRFSSIFFQFFYV